MWGVGGVGDCEEASFNQYLKYQIILDMFDRGQPLSDTSGGRNNN